MIAWMLGTGDGDDWPVASEALEPDTVGCLLSQVLLSI